LLTIVLDGLGLSIILPILDYKSAALPNKSKFSMLIYRFFEFFNIEISIISLVLFIVIIFILKAALRFAQEIIGATLTHNLGRELRINMIDQYKQMKYTFYVNSDIGYFNNILTNEVPKYVGAFKRYILVIVKAFQILVYLCFCFMFSWEISLLAIITGILIYFIYHGILVKVTKLSKELVVLNGSLQKSFIQFIYNFKYLKATSNFTNPVKKLVQNINKLRNKGFSQSIFEAITQVTLEPIAIIVFSITVFYLVIYQEKEISLITVTLLFLYRTVLRLPEFQTTLQKFMALTGSVDVVENATLNLTKNCELSGNLKICALSTAISLHDVYYHIGKRTILSNLNMKIKKNTSVGLVGNSGSGKSTTVDVLAGILIPSYGKVEIDDKNYSDINMFELRHFFGYVTQEPIMFNDTIINNITLWEEEKENRNLLDKVIKACEMANCHDFIHQTEHGYNSIVGDKGIKLSGGQRQRLAIARELYRSPELIFFDEATSSLDSESEQLIQKSLNNIKGKKTILIIAHRLTTIKTCDNIYVMDKGKIIEEGTWDYLINLPNSKFSQMCALQGIL